MYGGPQGALLATASHLSMHMPLGRRLFRTRKFDLRGMKSILDVGSGAGQIAGHLLEFADPEARITCMDISQPMLRRARQRLKSDRPALRRRGCYLPAIRRRFVRRHYVRICA